MRCRQWLAACALATSIAIAPLYADAFADPSRAQSDVEAAMRQEDYAFCRQPREPLSNAARALCPHAHAIAGCSGFEAACTRRQTRSSIDLPAWMAAALAGIVGWGAWVVVWVLLPGLALALLVPVVQALGRRRAERTEAAPLERHVRATPEPPEATPGEEALLARAEDRARQRVYAEALELYLAASLVSLDRRGALVLSRDRTNGECIRACTDAGARALLAKLSREVDRVKFGGGEATPEATQSAGAAAHAIVRGLVTTVAALVLLACAGCGGTWPGAPRPGDDPAGGELLVDLLHRQGFRTMRLDEALVSLPLPRPGERDAAVVVDLERTEVDDDTRAHLLEWVEAGGSLVLAGEPQAWPKELAVGSVVATRPRHVEARRLLARGATSPDGDEEEDEADDDAPTGPTPPLYASITAGGELADAEGLSPPADAEQVAWLDDGTPYAVVLARGQGWITAIATDELLTNAGLARPGNAAVALAILSNADREQLRIAQSEDGVSPPTTPLAAIERAGLALGLVHALVAAGILFAASGVRLARPAPERAPARRAFVEHVQAVGALYHRGGHAAHALAVFARFVDHRLRARMGRGGGDVAALLASRSGVPLDVCQRVHARAMRATDGDAPDAALKVLKELSAVYSLATERDG